LDTYNNEIIDSTLASRPADPHPYFECFDQLHRKGKVIHHPKVLQTDQGAMYFSRAFQQALIDYYITPSMSHVGTQRENAIIEAVNGEFYIDVKIHKQPNLQDTINIYIEYFNIVRLAYVNHYKTHIQYKLD